MKVVRSMTGLGQKRPSRATSAIGPLMLDEQTSGGVARLSAWGQKRTNLVPCRKWWC
jgi:hypothetical protein